jgi:signal transduction histidine kinase/CheY-like chemotaxis protein
MQNQTILSVLSEWTDEFNITLEKNNPLCIALFSSDKELLFANDSMASLFKDEPCNSFINPTFDKILTLDNSVTLIFDGFLTLGDYSSINTSLWAQIFRKKNKLLVLGGVNSTQLLEQNVTMHQLNREISNLQRTLIKEKHTLENTLIQLNEANNELKKLNTDKDRFVSILAHDLKSPFNSLLGFSELLTENIRTYDISEIENMVNIISSVSKQTYNLLEDILSWARAQSGKLPYEPQKLIFTDVCTEIIEINKLKADAKNIAIKYSSAEEIEITADVNMIKTILRNLVSNAIKFTHRGGSIDIYAEKSKSNVTISVSDNGVGITQNSLGKLFDKSLIYTTNGTADEKGSGLGLLLCREFVEKHGGKIWVESEKGKGSVFYFTIPCKIPCTAETEEQIVIKDVVPEEGKEDEEVQIKKLKILIVEDDVPSEKLLTKAVDMFDKEVSVVRTGLEAVEACRNNPDIDLVLMDIKIPEINGYEAARQIRQFNKDVIIIVQTAEALTSGREEAIEAGCNDYISKPIIKDELLAMIIKHQKKTSL